MAESDPCKSVLEQLQMQGILETCLAPDIFHPITLKPSDPLPPKEMALTYTPIRRDFQGQLRCQIKPTLTTYADASSFFAHFLEMFPDSAEGHDIRDPKIKKISFSEPTASGGFASADLEGTLTIQKRWRYHVPCIHGWEIRWCEKENIVYRFGAGWTASIRPTAISFLSGDPYDKNFALQPLPNGNFNYVLVSQPSKVSPFRSLENGFLVNVPKGSINFQLHISNDLVKIAQALTRVFGEYLRVVDAEFAGLLQLNYDQFRKFDIETYASNAAQGIAAAEEVHFVRDVLREQTGSHQSPHNSTPGRRENLALTAVLTGFAGKSTDFRPTTFSGVNGAFGVIEYGIDNSRLLDRIYTTTTVDPLYPKNFCVSTKKNIVSELRQILEENALSIRSDKIIPWRKAEEEGRLLFRKSELARTTASYRLFTANQNGPISRSDVVQYMRNRLVARNFTSFYELNRFYNFNDQERRCVQKKIVSLSRSINVVYPGLDFSDCVTSAPTLSTQQTTALARIDQMRATEITRQMSEEILAAPIQDAQYRGWYYCYMNAGICGSDALNVIRWEPGLSTFQGRPGNRNSGIDIFSMSHADGASAFNAVASGALYFIPARGDDAWGNALVLPFSTAGKQYFAVYAHLGNDAGRLDGTSVSRGEKIGVTGCSGGIGGRGGLCNSYCKYDNLYYTDESLHFEIIWRRGSLDFVPIAPTEIIPGWTPLIDSKNGVGNKVCAECRNGNCIPSALDGVH